MQLFAFVIALVVACVLAKEKTVVSEKDNALNCKLEKKDPRPFVGLSPLVGSSHWCAFTEQSVCVVLQLAVTLQTWLTKPTLFSLSLGCIHPQPPQTGEHSFGFAYVVQSDFRLQ